MLGRHPMTPQDAKEIAKMFGEAFSWVGHRISDATRRVVLIFTRKPIALEDPQLAQDFMQRMEDQNYTDHEIEYFNELWEQRRWIDLIAAFPEWAEFLERRGIQASPFQQPR